jgi:hypothetical protein
MNLFISHGPNDHVPNRHCNLFPEHDDVDLLGVVRLDPRNPTTALVIYKAYNSYCWRPYGISRALSINTSMIKSS